MLCRTCTMSSGRGFFGGGRGQNPSPQARGSRHRLNRRNLVDSSPDAGCSSPTSNSSVNPHLQSSPNPPAPPVIHPTSPAPSPTPQTSTGDAPDLPTPPPATQGDDSSSLNRIGTVDADGRMWIQPYSDSDFEPFNISRTISVIMKTKFDCSASTWSDVTPAQKKFYFGEFAKKYKWDPIHDVQIKKLWNKKSGDLLRATMEKVRRGIDKGVWMPESVREELRTRWNSPEYLQKRELGKKNRSSQTGGCLHSGGCIPHSEHQKRLRQELGHDPTFHDIFRRTHLKKGTQDQFIDSRSTTINDSFVKLKDTSSQASTSDTDGCEQQPIDENEIFLQATGGMSKKGRVYGIGSEARRLRSSPSSSSSSCGYFGSHSQNYLQQEIEERIARMNAELRDTVDTQQEHIVEQDRRIVEQDRKMEVMERMIASQQQMMQQYFASMGIQPPQPPTDYPPQPPTDYPEDNMEARNEGEDEDDNID